MTKLVDRRHNLKFDHKKAILYFKFVRSQTKTAEKFGVSRERIRQVVKKYDPELKSKYKERPSFCIRCKKTEEMIHITWRGYCLSCYQYKDHEPRVVETICRECKEPLNKRKWHAFTGTCNRCAYRLNYSGYRDRLRAAAKVSRRKYLDKYKATGRAYYALHKEEIKLHAKEYRKTLSPQQKTEYYKSRKKYYLAHKEQYREAVRRYRARLVLLKGTTSGGVV